MKVAVIWMFLLMSLMAEKSVEQLEKKISYYRDLYQNEGKREVSDREYEALVSKLRTLKPESEVLKSKDKYKLLSLQKVYDENKLFEWCEKVARNKDELFVIQPKYDGMAVLFKSCKLITRNGTVLKEKLPFIRQVGKCGCRSCPNVRGELLISNDEFAKLCKVTDKYSSPRHATVAFAHCKDLAFWQQNRIVFDFVCFDRFEKRLSLGEIRKNWKSLKNEIRNCSYDTDGLVIKLADQAYYESLGSTQKFSKGAIAFKWECERKWTILKDVEWQLAEKGIVPVGIVNTISLDGAKVARVSLYSLNYINEKGLGIGDMLAVERVGATVPIIKEFKKINNSKLIVLAKCPECDGKVKGSQCLNGSCCGKVTLAICKELKERKVKGVGRKTVKKLVVSLNLKSWQDFTNLSKNQITSVKGFGEKSAEKILSATR